MKIKCPKCAHQFQTSSIFIQNGTSNKFVNMKSPEHCPNCGYSFNAIQDGTYNVEDGVVKMITTLSGIEITGDELRNFKSIDFNSITTEDVLLEKTKAVGEDIFNLVKDWITKGIALITIIVALNTFLAKVNIEPATKAIVKPLTKIEMLAQQANMIPESAKKSFIASFSPIKLDSSISKERNSESLNVDRLKAKNDKKKKNRRK